MMTMATLKNLTIGTTWRTFNCHAVKATVAWLDALSLKARLTAFGFQVELYREDETTGEIFVRMES